jgi:hypothetical protein
MGLTRHKEFRRHAERHWRPRRDSPSSAPAAVPIRHRPFSISPTPTRRKQFRIRHIIYPSPAPFQITNGNAPKLSEQYRNRLRPGSPAGVRKGSRHRRILLQLRNNPEFEWTTMEASSRRSPRPEARSCHRIPTHRFYHCSNPSFLHRKNPHPLVPLVQAADWGKKLTIVS